MSTPPLPHHKVGRWGHRWRKRCTQVYAEETHCAWCGKYVDQTLHKDHPLSRTVDHDIELWQGGDPLPPRDQTHLMHRSCNTTKSNLARSRKTHPTPIHTNLDEV